MNNPNCDHGQRCSENPQVRRLPTGGNSAVIVCKHHYILEMMYRRVRNKELAEECQFDIPKWESLEVYTGC